MSIADRALAATRAAVLIAAIALTSLSCNGEKITNSVSSTGSGGNGGNGGNGGTGSTPTASRRVVGIAEVTFTNAASTTISANILLVTSVADLERLRTAAGQNGNLAAVQMQLIASGEFTQSPPGDVKTRFLRATFGLRNAGDSAVFDPSRENLSFVALRTANTLANSPVRRFQLANGSPASSALALQLLPTELSAIDADGNLITLASDVEAALSDDDVKKTALPAGASGIVPYSFVVRRLPLTADSGASVLSGQSSFDGEATFAFRLPVQPNAADNPTTISVLFLIVQTTAAAGTQ